MCVSFVNRLVSIERLLECTHEEADDRIFSSKKKKNGFFKPCFFNAWFLQERKERGLLYIGVLLYRVIVQNETLNNITYFNTQNFKILNVFMKCTHEQAADPTFFYANHAIKIGNYRSIVIASPDIDIFVSALHHFCKLKYFDVEELWFVSARRNSRILFRIHDLANDLDSNLAEVLPAIHALTGFDTARKYGRKSRAVREGTDWYHLLYAFGRDALSDEMIADCEKLLLKCITKHDVDTFDKLRFIVYHEKYLEFDIERFPPTSDNIRQHILRVTYLQCYI